MNKERRTFSPEFKQEAVALVVEHSYSYAAAGRSLGIRGNLIGRWKSQEQPLNIREKTVNQQPKLSYSRILLSHILHHQERTGLQTLRGIEPPRLSRRLYSLRG
jgi:hypothetical protein